MIVVNDVRIVGRFVARLRGEFVQASPEYAVEGWERVDDATTETYDVKFLRQVPIPRDHHRLAASP